MTYPDGMPYSLALDDRREGTRADLEREKASYKGHTHKFHFVLMESQISGSVPNAYDSPDRSQLLRSEEHTSELQSLMRISYAVFCLKKKKNKQPTITKQHK